jgi:hypothetical protein
VTVCCAVVVVVLCGRECMRRFVGGGSLFCFVVEVRCRVLALECQITGS